MKIIKATPKDAEELEKIFSILYKPRLKWTKEKISNELLNKKKEYYILTENIKTIGGIGLKFEKDGCKFGPFAIKKIYQRKKFGEKLIKFVEKLAIKKGCKKIWCYSLEIYKTREFYKKHKYEEKFLKNFWNNENCYKYFKILK